MFCCRYKDKLIIIFEYKDAEDEIARLAAANYGDMTLIASKGRARNKVEYYNYPCSFDIETTTIKPGQLNYPYSKYAPPIAFPYLFQWNIYGSVIMCRTYSEALNIFSWICEYFRLGANRRLVIFDHNLGYEEFFFRGLWDIKPEGSFAMDDHHPVSVLTEEGILFRDSYKMTNMSLETLSKDWSQTWFKDKEIMDYSVLRTPYSVLDENTYIYSALDVLSLSDSISGFLRAKNEWIWTKSTTSTSFIRFNFKKRIGLGVKKRTPEQVEYFRTLANQVMSKDMFEMQLRLARGGNTHNNRFTTGLYIDKSFHGDIISSYPGQMCLVPEYPIGVWFSLDPGCSIEDIQQLEKNGYCCMFDLALVNPRLKEGVTVPYISVSKMGIIQGSGMRYTDNGRYVGGLDVIRVSIYGIELPIILSQYDFDDSIVLKGYFAEKGYLPNILRNFILELYAQKTELKGVAGKEVEYALAKTYVNGVYGMAYTNPFRQTWTFTENGIEPEPEPDMEEFLEKYQKSISYFMPYSWGSMTAALGRVQLQKMIDAVGEDFLYCDTDSVFAKNPEKSRAAIKALDMELAEQRKLCGLKYIYKDIKGVEHELGAIDEEPECGFKSFGAKKYITIEGGKLKCTIAGVPKKAGARIISRFTFRKPKAKGYLRSGRALKGRRLRNNIENFKLGLNFKGSETGKNCLWYNEPPDFILKDEEGRIIETGYNVAMLPVDYLLSISRDYEECLSVEGNFHWQFKEGDINTINEEDL